MHGNVWEWVQDRYQGNYEGAGSVDPPGPAEKTQWNSKVDRGGGWYGPRINARSTARFYRDLKESTAYLGFRIVRKAKP